MSALIPALIPVLHWLAGLIVLAEALNKLERTHPFNAALTRRQRVVEVLKALAWSLLALGAGGALATPLIHLEKPPLQDLAVLLGFAVLIIRTRIKEG